MPDNSDLQSDNNDISPEELRYAPVASPNEEEASEVDEATSNETPGNEDAQPIQRTFEDLTLTELMRELMRSPRRTWRNFTHITTTPRESNRVMSVPMAIQQPATTSIPKSATPKTQKRFTISHAQIQLGLYILAVIVGIIGSSLLMGTPNIRRSEENALSVGAPYLWGAFFIWLGAELFRYWSSLNAWWNRSQRVEQVRWVLRSIPAFVWLTALLRFTDAMTAPPELALGQVQLAIGRVFLGIIIWIGIELSVSIIYYLAHRNPQQMSNWIEPTYQPTPITTIHRSSASIWEFITYSRVMLFFLSITASVLVWIGTPNNTLSPPVIALWFISAGLWSLVFAPANWNIFDWATNKLDTLRRFSWKKHRGYVIVFILIMILGMGFRFYHLDSLPQEMTSDHVEKILDSNRVFNGEYNIFFANNGGREPIQMYLMSLFSNLPGLDFNHFTLKLLAAIQSLITLPIMVWLGVELMGKEHKKFGLIIGLLLAGLVATSYWHVAITRQALRIVMTPIFSGLLLIYLARAIRENRRADFIKAALVLGFGLYAYQAVRMLPVVVVAGVAIAIAIRPISWRERFTYLVNLGVLVFISFMVFLPMLHYSLQDPDHFWRRTAGRILGDDVITEQRPDGTIIERNPTPEEQTAAFNANVPILMNNIRNALLMFNWKGDVGWISGVPNEPAMDIYTGTFLILGLAGWSVMMLRSRDPVIWLVPVMIFIMLLPSALSIAYPLENPSHTRTSGAIPPVYLVAAFPLAIIAFQLTKAFSRRVGLALAIVFCGGIILFANQRNTHLYFDVYPPIYIESSYPYSEAGSILRGFAESDGAYGNAFMIAYPHWWGHRAIGIASGEPFWPNGIVSLDDVPSFLSNSLIRNDRFKLDPNKDLLFFYSPDDEVTSLQLKEWFPEGREQEIQSYQPDDKYRLYRVPFLGEVELREFLARYNA